MNVKNFPISQEKHDRLLHQIELLSVLTQDLKYNPSDLELINLYRLDQLIKRASQTLAELYNLKLLALDTVLPISYLRQMQQMIDLVEMGQDSLVKHYQRRKLELLSEIKSLPQQAWSWLSQLTK